jgi:hypothetical protein
MSARDTDGFYWEPAPSDDLRQGDLLFNVPMALMPQTPRFVLGVESPVETQTRRLPGGRSVRSDRRRGSLRRARHGRHADLPRLRRREGQNLVAVVPVQSLNLVTGDILKSRRIREGKNVPLHLFHLPPTELGVGILPFHGVALLDRPASMLKDYRRLGLFVESRIALRKTLARFWARGDAGDNIERSMRPQIENRPLEDLE